MELTIEKLIYGGDGLGHHDGSTVFVPFVLPAERVAVATVEKKKKFVRARVESVLEPSPERAAPPCPYFGDCGGCHYQHIPYEAQLAYKAEILRETLRRLGGIDWRGEIARHASPPWGYRTRAQWKIRPVERSGAERPKLGIGYFRADSTALCAIESCQILSPLLEKTLRALRELLASDALSGEPSKGQLREIEAFSSEDAAGNNAKLLLTASFAGFPARPAELAERFRGALPELASLLFYDPVSERMELFGPGFLECEVSGASYRVGHFSFFQVNRFLAADLAREVADATPGGRFTLDLFAGVGLFSLPLAKHFERVIAVEANPAAARDLESNALRARSQMNSTGTIEVREAQAERFLQKFAERPDLVVLDPPRAGLTPGATQSLVKIAPARVTYVSCEPPTLARDLRTLCAADYAIDEVHLFDLFPQTFHMEVVVKLRHARLNSEHQP